MAVRELLAYFGVKVDTKELDKGHDKIEGLVGDLKHFGHALAGAFLFHEVESFVKKTVDAAQSLDRVANTLGMAADELQQYQHAADMVDVTNEQINASFRFLQKNAYAAANGSKMVGTVFKDLGIDLEDSDKKLRPTAELFDEVADRIKSLEDPAAQTALAMKIFGRNGAALLPMLKTGSEGIAEYRKEVEELGGGFQDSFLQLADKFDKHEKKLAFLKKSISAQLVGLAIPGLMTFGHYLEKAGLWILKANKNGELLRAVMIGFTAVALTKLPAVIAAVKHLATASNLAVAKWILLLAIGDELVTWFKGGDSYISDFFALFDAEINKSAEIFGSAVITMFSSWENFKAGLLAGAKTLGFGLIAQFNEVANSIDYILSYIRDAWDQMLQGMHLPAWMQSMLGGDAENAGADRRWKSYNEANKSREELGAWFDKSLSSDSAVNKLKEAIEARKKQAEVSRDIEGAAHVGENEIYKKENGTFVIPEQTVSAGGHGGGHGDVKTEIHDNSKTEVHVNVPGTTPHDIAQKTARAAARAVRSENNALLYSQEAVLE